MGDKKYTTKTLLLTLSALVLLGGSTVAVLFTKVHNDKQPPKVSFVTPAAQKPAKNTSYITYSGVDGQTALALLKQHATVIAKDSSYGPYVDTVNGVQGGTSGKYWAFYVNGKLADVGANAYTTKAGDKIEWKFE